MDHKFLSRFLIIILLVTFFAGCDLNKDDENPQPVDNYLVSYNQHKTYSASFITTMLTNLIPFYPEFQDILDHVEHDITVYKISYNTNFKGEEVVASGLVAIPNTIGESFPILSFQNGTNTLHSDAPSVDPDSQVYLLVEFVASTGFGVVFPDYLGFGTSSDMFHPYLEKESTVQSITDMLRAVKEMVNNYLDVEINDDIYITGYSQGGWSTMQLQRAIEEKYASEFHLIASTCGAGPYDLNYINNHILGLTEYPMPYYIGYIYNSFIQSGSITTPVAEVFKSPYDQRIMTLFDGTRSGGEINAQLTQTVADLFTEDYRVNWKTDEKYSSVVSGMTENSVAAWKTTTPTMIFHGLEDEYVPHQVSDNIYQEFLNKGVSTDVVKYFPITGADHESGVLPAQMAAFKWFIDLKNNP